MISPGCLFVPVFPGVEAVVDLVDEAVSGHAGDPAVLGQVQLCRHLWGRYLYDVRIGREGCGKAVKVREVAWI